MLRATIEALESTRMIKCRVPSGTRIVGPWADTSEDRARLAATGSNLHPVFHALIKKQITPERGRRFAG
jgi:hypothetical protein